jgi:hypothetical protein
LVGRLGVRKGIVFVAALGGVVLVLVIGGVSLLPDGVGLAEVGVDCDDPLGCSESGPGFVAPPSPEIDTRGPLFDGLIGVMTNPTTEPSPEPPRSCVFEATIRGVDREDPTVARVLVHERDGRETKAVVHRHGGDWRGGDSPVGESVKFFCSSKSEKDEALPVYEDCTQSSDPFDNGRCEDPNGCAPSLDGSVSPFRPVLAAGDSGTSWESKDGCVRVARPDEGCVGFCFHAFVKSVDEEDWRNAHVEIIEADGTRTRAVVRRSHVSPESRAPAREGVTVRFACFERVGDVGGVPGFDGCVQMVVPVLRDGGAARAQITTDVYDDPLGDHPLGF